MNNSLTGEKQDKTDAYKLGMFGGVFTPSILTILGIILFLRMGFTTGHAGLFKGLLLVFLACSVSVLTTASLSAIATNINVKGGGAYYLISRTLGVRFGGAIGLVLFLAQAVSIAFYCIGFGEAVAALVPDVFGVSAQSIACISVVFLFLMAWVGADLATKFQYVIMLLLVLALGSFFAGSIMKWDTATLIGNLSPPENALPFWTLFALFFPAVTGFTQGVNMSGDLKDPGRAIPKGTFMAVGLSSVIYLAVVVLFCGALPGAELIADYDAMKKTALYSPLIHAGVIAATLSSAMASFLGAPRILQSIAKDKIFQFLGPFEKGAGATDNPRRGIVLCLMIAIAVISLGQLNLVARVVAMFFLISYGLINYATFYEARTASPSFRPRFRWFSPWSGLAGFILCAGAVLAIDIQSGLLAVALLMAVYQYLGQHKGPARFSDSRRANYLQRAKENLAAAAADPENDRDWRPFILAFTNDSNRLQSILEFAGWLEGKAGITAAVRLIRGEGLKMKVIREKVQNELAAHIREIKSRAYPLVITVSRIADTLPVLIQSFGLGPVKANTVLINWMDELKTGLSSIGTARYARNLRIAYRQGLNLVILNADANRWERIRKRAPGEQRIDVWWNDDATSRLMLLLAYLMTRRSIWSRAEIRILSCESEREDVDMLEVLEQMTEDFRIDATPVIVSDNSSETMVEMSATSSLVFLPCRIRENQVLDIHGETLAKLLPYLPMASMVMAAQDIDLEAEPDTGILGEMAMAEDAFAKAQENYTTAKKESDTLRHHSQALAEELAKESRTSAHFEQLVKQTDQTIEAEEAAFRKAAKALAKVEQARKDLETLKKETGAGSDG